MTRLLLVRHGQSEWNALGRWQGWADPPLSEQGHEEAREAAQRLRGLTGPVLSSDLRRAAQTAEIIAEILGIDQVEQRPGLREIDVGKWTGLTRDEIEERFPGQQQAWRDGTLERPEGGESRAGFLRRIMSELDDACRRHPGRELLVVTHGGAIRAVERHLGAMEEHSVTNLGGRWLEAASPLRIASERLQLAG